MNILVTLNRGYLKYLKVMMVSLTENNPEEKVDLYIIHNSLTDEDLKEVSALSSCITCHSITASDDFLDDAPVTSRYPKEMYYRIFAGRFLPKDVSRILYLDPDIVIINSLHDLYNMDMEGNLFAAASHLDDNSIMTVINDLRLSMPVGTGYFNSGVMLIDVGALRREISEKQVFSFIDEHKSSLILPDQDVLNGIFAERTKLISPYIYNLSDRTMTLYNMKNLIENRMTLSWVEKNTSIIHYFGRNKPWKENYMGVLDCYYKVYEQRLLDIEKGKN